MLVKKTRVYLDNSPLKSGHAVRGVGVYTKYLSQALDKLSSVHLSRSSNTAELIHYPYYDFYFNTLPIFSKKKRVVTIHDVIPLVFKEKYPSGLKAELIFMKQKLALRQVDAIITDSKASKRDIHKYLSVPKNKIHVTYLAGNPELAYLGKKQQQAVRNKYKLPEKYLLYVGDINYNKNIPELLKMMKYLPQDLHLLCLGKNFRPQAIPEWRIIEQTLLAHSLKNRVHFLRSVSHKSSDELAAVYSGALAYVQPSLYEGFGLPVLEAMQCLTPVIVSKNSSLTEVGGKWAKYSKPKAKDFARQVKKYLNMSDSRKKVWLKHAYRWSQEFSWKKTAATTAAVYDKVLAK